MEKKDNNEIVSFNVTVPELPSLIELDEALLDEVTGGMVDTCGSRCGTRCTSLCGTDCGTDLGYTK